MILYNEYQLMPYIDADQRQYNDKQIKQIFKDVHKFDSRTFTSSTTADRSCLVVQSDSDNTYECVEISHNRVYLTKLKKTQPSFEGLIRFAFSFCRRYFVQENGSCFSIVDLGEFQRFFSPQYNLCEDQKENYFAIGLSKKPAKKDEDP